MAKWELDLQKVHSFLWEKGVSLEELENESKYPEYVETYLRSIGDLRQVSKCEKAIGRNRIVCYSID